ncbi:MAG TPA: M24 family metallopeptidase [Propionibacteriaceae bacterium]|nr:M24 family metallopeptidase [Propionibacteriaceae bacterium]
MQIGLHHVSLPGFGVPEEQPTIPTAEYDDRARRLYAAADADWVVVYGDREHYANLTWLSGFDPRFEESLLLLGPGDQRVLVVGNEDVGYAPVAGLPAEVILYQPFSLMAQPRGSSPKLADLLRNVGLGPGVRVGVVGWKYFDQAEEDVQELPPFVPAFVVETLHRVTGAAPSDITAVLMHPAQGLRARNSVAQVAVFEWAAARASAAVLRVVRATKPGMTEFAAMGAMVYQGEPMVCHPVFASGNGQLIGLRSPSARRITPGDVAVVAVGYWGGLSCRAGLVTEEPDDDFFNTLVRPYYTAIALWYSTVKVGVSGDEVYQPITESLASAGLRPFLNPGHLTSYEEWLHSPIDEGSEMQLASGMALQCDIIPTPVPDGRFINCEDTIVLADDELRQELKREHPEVWRRIEARRTFMRDELGLQPGPDVLPLSTMPAYLPPYWLNNTLVCTVGE